MMQWEVLVVDGNLWGLFGGQNMVATLLHIYA
jgi:hypothetical protein